MQSRTIFTILCCTALMMGAVASIPMRLMAADPNPEPETANKQTAEEAFLRLHKEMASGNKTRQLKALKATMPTKKDVEALFPKHAADLWPLFEEENQTFLKDVENVAKQITRGGEIDKIKATNLRKNKDACERSHMRVFAMMPKDAPVYKIVVIRKDRSSRDVAEFVYVNKRWLAMNDLDQIPKALDEFVKKKKSKQ